MLGLVISRISLVLALVLAPPATAVLATWNTLPGQTLYPVKKGLEKVAGIFLSPSYQASSEFEIKLVSRRLGETQTLLTQSSDQSSAGLQELVAQAQSARTKVLSGNTTDKKQTQKLVQELNTAKQKLQQQQIALGGSPTYTQPTTNPAPIQPSVINITNVTIVNQSPNPEPGSTTPNQPGSVATNTTPQTNTANPNPLPTQTTQTAAPPAATQIQQDIDNTLKQLDKITKEIESAAPPPPTKNVGPTFKTIDDTKQTKDIPQKSPTPPPTAAPAPSAPTPTSKGTFTPTPNINKSSPTPTPTTTTSGGSSGGGGNNLFAN